MSAAEFLVDAVKRWPGEVTVLALGPLTNIALAAQLDPSFVDNLVCAVSAAGALFSAFPPLHHINANRLHIQQVNAIGSWCYRALENSRFKALL